MYYLLKLWKTACDYATLVLIAGAISARLAFLILYTKYYTCSIFYLALWMIARVS